MVAAKRRHQFVCAVFYYMHNWATVLIQAFQEDTVSEEGSLKQGLQRHTCREGFKRLYILRADSSLMLRHGVGNGASEH